MWRFFTWRLVPPGCCRKKILKTCLMRSKPITDIMVVVQRKYLFCEVQSRGREAASQLLGLLRETGWCITDGIGRWAVCDKLPKSLGLGWRWDSRIHCAPGLCSITSYRRLFDDFEDHTCKVGSYLGSTGCRSLFSRVRIWDPVECFPKEVIWGKVRCYP